jgi:hypothetical protein
LGELQIWQSFSSFVVFHFLCCWHLPPNPIWICLFVFLLNKSWAS